MVASATIGQTQKKASKTMSTKKDHERTLLGEFEVMVQELQRRGFTDVDIHSLVNMIIQGWMRNGQPTAEYVELAAAAARAREAQEPMPIEIIKTPRG